MSDKDIEQEIQAKGLAAPRITPADIEANISSEHYFTALDGVDGRYRGGPEAQGCLNARQLGLLTFCVLVLRKIARQNAVNKIWPLMGYELRSKLAQ